MKTELGLLIAAALVSAALVFPLELWFPGVPSLDPRLRPVAGVFGLLWVGFRLRVFCKARQRWRSWRLPASWSVRAEDLPFETGSVPLTHALARLLCRWKWPARLLYPDKGILLGRAFRWSPEHTQELETHLQGGQSLPVGRDMRGGYPALHAVGKKAEQPLVLPWSELVGHVLIGGTTRSGKTRLLEVILSEAIRGPGTVIIIDPKGDAELLVRAATEAYRSGRKFAFFSPAHADYSATFNPFSMCTNTTELAARVQALMPGGGGMAKGDPFFTEYPLAIIERLGAAQEALGEKWTIEGLHAVTTMVPPFDDLLTRYLYQVLGGRDNWEPSLEELIEEYGRKRSEKQDHLADALIDDKEKPRDHFVQVTANLVPAFRGVTGGKMARLLSSEDPQLTWKGVVEERKVVYFAMSSLLYGEVANRIGRVILQDLIGFLGERYARDDPAKMTPLTILIDEFSNVAYPGFIDALNKGGGAKANIMLAMQSLADPEAAMGKDGTQRVLDNLNTRIWFRLTDDATAKLAVEGLGMTSVSREDISHSLSFGGTSGASGGTRGAMQYVDRSLVRSEWVTGLPRGEAFVRTRGENWKLRVPLLEPVPKDELKKVAAHFKLEHVLAEFKEQVQARARQKGTSDERMLAGGIKSQEEGSGKDSADEAAGKTADALKKTASGRNGGSTGSAEASEIGVGLKDGTDMLGAAFVTGVASDGAEDETTGAKETPEPAQEEPRTEETSTQAASEAAASASGTRDLLAAVGDDEEAEVSALLAAISDQEDEQVTGKGGKA